MKTGYHAIYAKDYFDGIDAAKNNGFDFVQFDLGVRKFFLNGLSDQELAGIREYAESNGIQITFHAPGDNVALLCDYPIIKKGILDEFTLILEKANKLNARHVTFHAGNYSQFKKSGTKTDESNLSYYEQVLYDNMAYLVNRSGGVLVCMENFQWSEVTRKAIKRLIDGGKALYLTLDIPKLYKSKNMAEIINDDYNLFVQYSGCIREMHIHDMNDEFGSHQAVGTGNIDFSLFQAFYSEKVYLNFEVRPVESAKISKDNLFKIWRAK